jgi:hypothetical protein
MGKVIFKIGFSFIALNICSAAHAQTISFQSKVKVKKMNETQFSEIAETEKIGLKAGESMLLVPREGLPIIFYSPISANSELKVSDAVLSDLFHERQQETLNSYINEIVDGIRKTESAIKYREYGQALLSITQLKNKYPQVSSVLFMSGTVHYLNNNKSAASEDLEKGLLIEPNNLAAKKLLHQLKGKL